MEDIKILPVYEKEGLEVCWNNSICYKVCGFNEI